MKSAVKVTITGTVQGVFFRQFIKEHADKLNLKGFTRNLENGNVEVVLEGDKENIEKMIEILKKGPEHAIIKDVYVEKKKYSGDYKEFKIIRF